MSEFYDKHFMWIEFIIALTLSIALVLIFECWIGQNILINMLNSNYQDFYSAAASVCGTMLGFELAAVSVILVFGEMPRLRLIRESGQYKQVFEIYFTSIYISAAATLWALVGLMLDTNTSPKPWVTYVMFWLLITMIFRIFRCVWILRQITDLALRPRK